METKFTLIERQIQILSGTVYFVQLPCVVLTLYQVKKGRYEPCLRPKKGSFYLDFGGLHDKKRHISIITQCIAWKLSGCIAN